MIQGNAVPAASKNLWLKALPTSFDSQITVVWLTNGRPAKTDEPIEMPFGMRTPRAQVIGGAGPDPPRVDTVDTWLAGGLNSIQ